ncbi:MAG TPA: DUF3147 family protein [Burkholderiales bacterium]
MEYLVRVVVSALIIVVVAEIAKRSTVLGGLIASLPLVSILAFVWLYLDTRSTERVAALSYSIFWLVLPSLSFFLVLPWLLQKTGNFYLGLAGSIAIMLVVYGALVLALQRWGAEL